MQRKPGFPVANCSIKMPDSMPVMEGVVEEEEPLQRRQQLINFGHAQWGFNNWNWSVTKQDLDFVELSNGKYTAGVVSFVSVTVKTINVHRENIGYATSLGPNKGSAIHRARKCAVTNALRETLLGFGGNVATKLIELLEARKPESVPSTPVPAPALTPAPPPAPEPQHENQNPPTNHHNPPTNHHNPPTNHHNTPTNHHNPPTNHHNTPTNHHNPPTNHHNPPTNQPMKHEPRKELPCVKNVLVPPVARAHPMPANLPPAANAPRAPPPPAAAPPAPLPPAAAPARPSSNVKLADLTEEEARAERKRRQRQAQEEFRLKQLMKQQDTDENQEISINTNLETLLMAIPSQDFAIEDSGSTGDRKRKSPGPEAGNNKRPYSDRNNIVKTSPFKN